jgi:hypothetical protein
VLGGIGGSTGLGTVNFAGSGSTATAPGYSAGGGSFMGIGGLPSRTNNVVGSVGRGYGGGGGGSAASSSQNILGAAGTSGVVIVEY